MKFSIFFTLIASASATTYNAVPADGIFVFVKDHYDASVDRSVRSQIAKEELKESLKADGLYHTAQGIFDAQGKRVDDDPISL